ncbi:sensor histidine kinase [Kribbella jiaozuonensis]|uniref:histidine kinase n=1 Tax=Kribbella jiaozuonensis TaxID=2575441 RepID=A0A4U3LX05_9ACTN|nr:histidine kinase [Kribbella jiaozuonensis]TKK79376.1 two-component sensor histidine kinase [Kribbella jiaozuonensis]
MSIDRRTWVGLLLGLVLVEAVVAVVGAVTIGLSYSQARDSFMIPNAVVGISCAVSGGLIAWHRPRNWLGWLLLGVGIAQTGTPAVTPWLIHALEGTGSAQLPATLYSLLWPWSVSLFIPLALLVFPDGKLLWRAVLVVALVNAPLQVLLFSADRNPLAAVDGLAAQDRAVSWLRIPALDGLVPLQTVSDLLLAGTFLAAIAGLVVRYRRGDERVRRQLLWLLLAATVAAVLVVSLRFAGPIGSTGFPIIVLTLVALIPASMTVAVLRYQLLDIRLVWSRTVTYLLLTAAVAAAYLGLVELTDRLLRPRINASGAVLATLVVAIGFNPVRVRLQRLVDRLFYGDRGNPVRAASSVAAQLTGASQPADVLPAVCQALRLPYAALADEAGVIRGEHGVRPSLLVAIPLLQAGAPVGELQVGVRPGEKRLSAADRVVLELMAAPLGVALRAQALSDAVQQSRRELVAAREEERRRLRRDLHDGLGPALTGIGFRADAVMNLADDPVQPLAAEIRAIVDSAIADVRRLINQLHPSALDEVGLVEAVRRHAALVDRRGDGSPLQVTVRADEVPDGLPAVVEVTAYRIVTEALTNVARHSRAGEAEVRISGDGRALRLSIVDDGPAVNGQWVPGVGLTSMRERVAELGGTLVAEGTATGGRVQTCLPLEVSR